jgi:competence protein ComEA
VVYMSLVCYIISSFENLKKNKRKMHKNGKRIRKFLKEYFIFSTGERKGIITLLGLLAILIALPYLYKIVFPPRPLDIKITTIPATDEPVTSFASYKNDEKETSLLSFDPNTATDEQLLGLGFTEFNVKTIRKYVTKGGTFRKPDDLKKIFGIKPKLFLKVQPFIHISSQKKNIPGDSTYQHKKKTNKIVELNMADSGELVALYRIGPGLAHRIIEYRDKLGGFVSIEQLKEIWGFDEDILYDLQGKISVDASKAKIYNVNTVTAEELKTHPYFKYKLSNAIVNYRMQHGNYSKLENLKKIVIINDSVYKKIITYLKTD